MGAKYRNLQQLYRQKVNVHDFMNAESVSDLLEYSSKYDKFSIRFDSDTAYYQRPFYKYDAKNYKTLEARKKYFNELVDEAKEKGCTMVCSNGFGYDDIQICNFVIKINEQYDFVLEWCTEKIALREMYQYKTTVLTGNIRNELGDMEWTNKNDNKIEDKQIEEILSWAFKIGCFNKNIEGTLYPVPVGLLNEKIVCWQTD